MRVYQTAVTVTGVPCAPSPLLYEEPLRTVRFMGRGCQNQSRSGTSRLVPGLSWWTRFKRCWLVEGSVCVYVRACMAEGMCVCEGLYGG